MDLGMTTVLVTGGAGFIGSHACKALAGAGYRPVVVDNLSLGHADAVKWGPLEVGDIRNSAFLNKVIAKYSPEAVMHFAASSDVVESATEPAKYYSNNVVGSLTLLEAVRQNEIEHFILSSTCATYGITDGLPLIEASPQNPITPYGATKLAVEHALADYGRAYELKWASLRYFNAAGADLEGELGERHTPETHIIPLAIMAAFSYSPVFDVPGIDYPTPDGSAIRDYIHVADLAEAHVKSLDYLRAGGQSSAFNLGTGTGTTVLQVLEAVQACTGRRLHLRGQPRRPGDPAVLYAAAGKAAQILDWHPQHREIETIVGSAVSWFRHNMAA
jgi:UDP-arabinose 4-epimerase